MGIRKDFLGKQIEQLAQALAKMIADMLLLKNQGNANGIDLINESLQSELDFNLDAIVAASETEFLETLLKKENCNNDNLEKLADLLMIIADGNESVKENLLKKSLHLYRYIDDTGKIFSMERKLKIDTITAQLQ